MKTIPTLSGRGWVTSLEDKANQAMAYWLASDYSQSDTFNGNISSLQYEISQFTGDAVELQTTLQTKASNYFSRFFDSADIEVRVVDDGTSKLGISIAATLTDDGEEVSLSKALTYTVGATQSILEALQGD